LGVDVPKALGRAIDVLRSGADEFFTRASGAPDYSIFSEDVVLVDQRAPSFRIRGVEAYRRTMDAIRWSLTTACDHQRFEILSVVPPTNGVLYMRWRLRLWPKNPFESARDFLAPTLRWDNPLLRSSALGEPSTVEGYSRYEFDAWEGKIVRHSVDITNPPTPLANLLRPTLDAPLAALAPGISRPMM